VNILYIGDVMAEVGLTAVEKQLPALKRKHKVDLTIAQAENVSEGKGLLPSDFLRLKMMGVDFCTGGNHTFAREEIFPQLNDPAQPVIRPANYPVGTPGRGYKSIDTPKGKVLVVSLLGQIVGKDSGKAVDNPLHVIDRILDDEKAAGHVATIVNFHGDFSSEKRIIGHYLDGRITALIGDHWHTQTNDGDILPGGTAHITDVGMCGSLDSSLGVSYETLIPRWRDGVITRNVMETRGRVQFNAFLITADENTGLATGVETIRSVW
jgi:metallophosphoesterase (TIGR00282 family)